MCIISRGSQPQVRHSRSDVTEEHLESPRGPGISDFGALLSWSTLTGKKKDSISQPHGKRDADTQGEHSALETLQVVSGLESVQPGRHLFLPL